MVATGWATPSRRLIRVWPSSMAGRGSAPPATLGSWLTGCWPPRMMNAPRQQTSREEVPAPNRARVVIAAAFVAAMANAGPAGADPLGVAEFGQLALRCGASVAPSTLAAIARTESAFQPLSINDNTTGTSGVPATRDIAVQIASKLLEAGHSIDIGIMQINSGNFARLGLTLQAAFDPCRSVAAAALILAGDYTGGDSHEGQQAALRVAISKYNTGDAQRGFANGYVHKVELAVRHVVPALDVGAAPAAIDSQPAPAAAPAIPVDPDAPPSWAVWPSYDYAATHHHDVRLPAASTPVAGAALSAAAGGGPAAAVTVSGPAVER